MKLLQFSHSDYLSNPAIGASDIIRMSKSFAYWKYRKDNPEKPGRPLVIGSATHLLLQAELTNSKSLVDVGIKVYQDGSSLTKGFKEFQTTNSTQYCLDQEEWRLCNRMVKAILEEPEVMGYLTGAIAEATIMGKYPHTDIMCKCRPDYLHLERGVSVNIKTTTEATESNFIYGAKDYGYDFQSAFYIDLLTQECGKSFDEVHILVEKTEENEPPVVKIFSFGDDTIAWARSQIRTLMEKIPECQKTGIWPKNKAFLETVDLPLYARRIVQP
jgi:hypothetical protein